MNIGRGVLIGAVALVGVAFAVTGVRADEGTTRWVAVLAGENEVPVRDTHARGVAIFHLSEDGQSIEYKLIVANIENVIASHIHIAPAGVNGPVVIFLFGSGAPGGGRVSGPIAEGVLTAGGPRGPPAGAPFPAPRRTAHRASSP